MMDVASMSRPERGANVCIFVLLHYRVFKK